MESTTRALTVSDRIKDKIRHDWQQVPAEFIAYGIEHRKNAHEESARRVAYLLLDVGVESLLKAKLSVSSRPSEDRKDNPKGRDFPSIANAVYEILPSQFSEADKKEAIRYHGIRNQIYHDGLGIVPSDASLDGYAAFAVKILFTVLAVDLSDWMREPRNEPGQKPSEQSEQERLLKENRRQAQEAVAVKIDELRAKRKEVDALLKEIADWVAPKLLSEDTWRRFYEALNNPKPSLPAAFFGVKDANDDESGRPQPEQFFVKFLSKHISDDEARSYFLGLSAEGRYKIAHHLVWWIEEELFWEFDPLSLSLVLLSYWPDFPYDRENYMILLDDAQMYEMELFRPGADNEPAIWEDLGESNVHAVLTEGDNRLRALDELCQELSDWRSERESQYWK